jgi:hypothetical protein
MPTHKYPNSVSHGLSVLELRDDYTMAAANPATSTILKAGEDTELVAKSRGIVSIITLAPTNSTKQLCFYQQRLVFGDKDEGGQTPYTVCYFVESNEDNKQEKL